MPNTPEQVADDSLPTLIGRTAEFAGLAYLVGEPSQRRPTLVVVRGEEGLGKSVFLGQAGRFASERGWRVMRVADEANDPVTPTTTVEEFRATLRRLFDPPDNIGDAMLPSQPAALSMIRHDALQWGNRVPSVSPLVALSSSRTSATVQFGASSIIPRLARAALRLDWSHVVEIVHGLAAAGESIEDIARTEPLAVRFVQEPPTLLVIDNFRPSPAFTDWFATHWVGDLRRVHAPLLLLVAARPNTAADLEATADEVITIGPLEPEAVAAYLGGLNVQPPLAQSELAEYVATVCQRPKLLPSLTHVLSLVADATPMPK